MFKKILIPLDTSELATRVLDYLPPLVDKEQTELVLMSAIVPDTYFYATSADEPEMLAQLMERIEQRFSRHMIEVRERLTSQGYRVKLTLLYGDGAQSIVDVATREGCDLIAMTTHGRSGFRRWMMGSVADRVIRSASQPILLARTEPALTTPMALNNLLLPLDGSALAEYAFPVAQGVASRANAKVNILHAASESEGPAKLEGYLQNMCDRLSEANVESGFELVTGSPVNAILERAGSKDIDLIVMNSHGRSGYFRWAQGSVATKVIQETTCPILLTRGLPMVEIKD